MTQLKIVHRPKAGHTKCFRCRESCLSREGSWHDHEVGQIFLCKPCEKKPALPRKDAS